MFYVYVLESSNDSGFCIGCTKDVKDRIKEHNSGHIEATKNTLPMKLVYYEAFLDKSDEFRGEKHLKTTYGRRYIENRLRGYFTG
jgi:putative endonuclease